MIRTVDIRESDCTLDLDDLKSKLNAKTKLVAVGYASNAVGTINPVAEITKLAHAAGAMIYIDAVHYAPHGPIDVKALDCDFLVCSPYKFFRPAHGHAVRKKRTSGAFQAVQSSARNRYRSGMLGDRNASAGVDRRNSRCGRIHRGTWPALRSIGENPARGAARVVPLDGRVRTYAGDAVDRRLARHSRPAIFRHHRSQSIRRTLLDGFVSPRQGHTNRRRNISRRTRNFHLGRQFLRAQPDRAPRRRKTGRRPPRRLGPLQHRGRSRPSARRAERICAA